MRYRAVLLSTIIFIALSGPMESLIARHISPNLQYRTTILLCLGLGFGTSIYTLLKRPSQFWRAIRAAWPALAFAFIAMASTLWSSNSNATLTAGTALLFFTLAATMLVGLVRWDELLMGIAIACIIIGVLSLILIPIGGLMTEIHEGALRGPYGEKNRAGMVFAIGAVSCMAVAFQRRTPFWLLGVPFFLMLLFLSQSGTSLLAAVLALSALSFGEILRGHPKRLVIGSWLGFIAAGGIAFIVLTNAETLLDLAGEDSTFTGRDRIWPSVMWRIQENLFLGQGYDAFWREGNTSMDWLWYEAGFEVFNAHNGWLEIMLGVGLLGLIPVAWMILRAVLASFAGLNLDNDARRMALPFIIMVIMMSLTESAIGGPEGPSWLILLIVAIKAAMGEEAPTANRRAKPAR
jgi:O-antigen ligase